MEPHTIDVPAADEITLMELIEAVLRHEADAFLRRRDAAAMIRFLTENGAGRAVAHPIVCFGDLEANEITIDTDAAVENARQAFDDGVFTATCGGRRMESLEEPIAVVDGTEVVFDAAGPRSQATRPSSRAVGAAPASTLATAVVGHPTVTRVV